jgi:Cu2+-exporting ATPase
MAMSQVSLPDQIEQATNTAHEHGHSMVYVALDGQLAGALELRPSIRPEAQQIVDHLHARGITTYIISGDHEEPTRILARQLGIDNVVAETLPEDKAAQIAKFQSEGKFVCFIGDGINDAIALRTAQVSISLRGATSLATDTAQIIMMDQSLRQLSTLLRLSDEFEANMQMNLTTSIVPGLIIIGGAFAGVVSYTSSIPIYAAGLTWGAVNAMLPRVKLMRRLLADERDGMHAA